MNKLLLSMMIALAQASAMAQAQVPATVPATAPATAPAESGWNAFLTGLGIAGDTAHLIVTILAIALAAGVVVFMVRMVTRKDTPASPALSGSTKQILPTEPPKRSGHVKPKPVPVPVPVAPVLTPAQKWGMPEGFDDQAFLADAKASFIRMQAAWDKADTNDLREFTTPQVFAELKAQVEQRPQSNDVTDVVSIDAELLGIETVGDDHLASVKFNGMIKSSATAVAEPFAEVWNLAKPLNGSGGWMLAGIQQLS